MKELVFANGCRVDVVKVTGLSPLQAGDTLVRTEDGADSVFVTEDERTVRHMLQAAGWTAKKRRRRERFKNNAARECEEDWFDTLGEVTQPMPPLPDPDPSDTIPIIL